jgi:hypothetical protein
MGNLVGPAFELNSPFTETDTTITVTFQMGGWLKHEVRIDIGFDSIDIFLTRSDNVPVIKSFDLEAPVIAAESSIRYSSTGLELVLKKRVPAIWGKLFVKLVPETPAMERWIAEIQAQGKEFDEVDDAGLAQAFEEAQVETLGMPKDRIKH